MNKTLKQRLIRYMTSNNNHQWAGVLNDMVININHTQNSAIGMAPVEVRDENLHEIRRRLFEGEGRYKHPPQAGKDILPKFKVGDTVRLQSEKKTFKRGFDQQYTQEVFRVTKVDRVEEGFRYKVQALDYEDIYGWFSQPELTLVSVTQQPEPETESTPDPSGTIRYAIDKILAKKRGQVLVSYKGYPDSTNKWVPAHTLQQ